LRGSSAPINDAAKQAAMSTVNQALNDNDGSSRRPLQRRLDDGGGGEPSSPKGMNEEKLRKGIAEAKRLQVVVTIRRSRQQDRYIF
jgi:hypothetical protein